MRAVNLPGPLSVLILGDSLSLCGFGESLDKKFRSDAQVKSTFTYMACGTIPVSWLKQKPFTNAKTYCGFWSIESDPDAAKPKEFQDTYGMRRGSRPKPHLVPKLDDLLSAIRPEILVMQTGNNILSLFRDGKTVLPARHGPILKQLIAPFLSEALKAPSTLQRIYWVASPTSGRVSKGVQDFVVEQVRMLSAGEVTVIDSRPLVSYPYRHMAPDREHFSEQAAGKIHCFESSARLCPQGARSICDPCTARFRQGVLAKPPRPFRSRPFLPWVQD
jgi:hypothetical protein